MIPIKKIAVCFYGYFERENRSGIKSLPFIKKYIIDKYNPDVYIHCWQPEYKNFLEKEYNPIKIITENQKCFKNYLKYIDNEIYGNNGPVEKYLSQFYSLETSYNLIDKKYDIIILLRPDNFDINFRVSNNGIIFFDMNNFDINYINTEYWNQINAGLMPHYFIGDQLLMDKLFKNIFNDVLSYFNPNSEYIKLSCEIGWPYSDIDDEFSNIILKSDNSKKLVIYSKNKLANDHLILKYHFFRLNLLNNVCYVGEKGIIFIKMCKN